MWCEEEEPTHSTQPRETTGNDNSNASPTMEERDEQARKDRMLELARLNALETAQVTAYADAYTRSFEVAFASALEAPVPNAAKPAQ